MPFIDSHVHLPLLDSSVKEAICLCRNDGIKLFLNVGYDYKSSKLSWQLSKAFPEVYASAGIHPHYVSFDEYKLFESWLNRENIFNQPKMLAWGEIGLDYVRSTKEKKIQQEFFDLQLQSAFKHKKPVIIHNREADQDVFNHISRYPGMTGIMHCFSSHDEEFAHNMIAKGFMISFAGNVTYPNASKLRDIAQKIPLDHLLIETDAPYLSPQNFRGTKNHPIHVISIYQFLSELRQIPLTELQSRVYDNFCRIFHLR